MNTIQVHRVLEASGSDALVFYSNLNANLAAMVSEASARGVIFVDSRLNTNQAKLSSEAAGRQVNVF